MSLIFDMDAMDNPNYEQYRCKGCSDRVRITTTLAWYAIDHNSWKHEKSWTTESTFHTFISRATCWDALAAAAAVEAMCEKYNKYFSFTDVYDAPFID